MTYKGLVEGAIRYEGSKRKEYKARTAAGELLCSQGVGYYPNCSAPCMDQAVEEYKFEDCGEIHISRSCKKHSGFRPKNMVPGSLKIF